MKQRTAVVKEDAPPSGICKTGNAMAKEDTPTNPGGVGGYTARLFTVRGL